MQTKPTKTNQNALDRVEVSRAIRKLAGCWLRAKQCYYRAQFDREKRAELRAAFLAYADAIVYLVQDRPNACVCETYTRDGRIALDVCRTVYALNSEREARVYRVY